ncbi:hypothetical protein GCM10017655_11610 [Pseudomonas turukhanskensis]|uniref:Acyltransferase n=1 Tax=Pseudomonas turukhanskensis TaxID=1806536 RepID=A0A9W6K5X9_9PSED|nr:hypothetical protein GCM10017655_11610 [Pseudomonas turukhanskensis]
MFFVISGFLMTGIILRGLEAGTARPFSIIGFYLSRARRILPALLVLCLVLMVVGWFVLPATEYLQLGKHAISALGFLSNVLFWREDGYFDSASHDKLLLHTWSLSVEWQFYLLLPVFMVMVWKFRQSRQAQAIALAGVLLLSLLLCVVGTPIKTTAAFYLLPTRAWEMLAGGLVYLLSLRLVLTPATQRVLETCGFALLLGTIVLFDSNSQWPGWRAIVPVLATMLVLLAARQDSLWTGTRLAQWLGDSSYSLYLWHWPLVVSLVYLQRQDSVPAIAAGILLAALLGGLSYRFVEQPARDNLNLMRQRIGALVIVAVTVLVMLPAGVILLQHGVPGRLPVEIDAVFAEAENKNPRMGECMQNEFSQVPECTYGGPRLGAIVVGDSHAGALIRAVERALPSTDEHVLDWTMSNCPTIANIKAVGQLTYKCGTFIASKSQSSDTQHERAPLLIINRTSNYLLGPNEPDRTREVAVPELYMDKPFDSRSPEYLQTLREGIIDTACAFAKHRPVYMLRPIPELKRNVPKTMGRALMMGIQMRVSISLDEYHERNAYAWKTQDMAAARCGVVILDPLPLLCRDGQCYGDVNGHPLYFDDDHLSEFGGDRLRPLFSSMFLTTDSSAHDVPLVETTRP